MGVHPFLSQYAGLPDERVGRGDAVLPVGAGGSARVDAKDLAVRDAPVLRVAVTCALPAVANGQSDLLVKQEKKESEELNKRLAWWKSRRRSS